MIYVAFLVYYVVGLGVTFGIRRWATSLTIPEAIGLAFLWPIALLFTLIMWSIGTDD